MIYGHVPAGDKLSSASPANTGDHGNVALTQDKLCCISYDKVWRKKDLKTTGLSWPSLLLSPQNPHGLQQPVWAPSELPKCIKCVWAGIFKFNMSHFARWKTLRQAALLLPMEIMQLIAPALTSWETHIKGELGDWHRPPVTTTKMSFRQSQNICLIQPKGSHTFPKRERVSEVSSCSAQSSHPLLCPRSQDWVNLEFTFLGKAAGTSAVQACQQLLECHRGKQSL